MNAGVGAYGIDQAYLRAEQLLPKYRPSVVVLSFISDDINRTEVAYYRHGRGWKPYFEYERDRLILRNVPVPREPLPGVFSETPLLRRILGRSVLADAVLDRVVQPRIDKVHDRGEAVSVELLVMLDRLCREQGARLLATALFASGRIGNNARLPSVVSAARQRGVEVLDLATASLTFDPMVLQQLFRPGGHYAPPLNRWVAEQLAAVLKASTLHSVQPLSVPSRSHSHDGPAGVRAGQANLP
jgi:hypothetical protein